MYHTMQSLRLHIYTFYFILFFVIILNACSEDLQVIDLGINDQNINHMNDMQPSAGEDLKEGCQSDAECSSGTYCNTDEDSDGRCVAGCRSEPDSCAVAGSRKRCNIDTRECELTCESDRECFDDQRCADGLCVDGCRPSDPLSCPQLDRDLQYCNADNYQCETAIICCDVDNQCSLTGAQVCEGGGGEVMLGVNSCQPSPCRASCFNDTLCAANEYCTNYGRCAIGCRIDDVASCPPHLSCDEDSRQCLPQNCMQDEECADWQYCAADRTCLPGCRTESCTDGQVCNDAHQCVSQCVQDEECDGAYCDLEQGVCRTFCDANTQEGCDPGELCVEQRCIQSCLDDDADIIGNDSREQATILEWNDMQNDRDDLQHTRVTSYILCPERQQGTISNEDWYQITLSAGDRVRLQVQGDLQYGDLQVFFYHPNGELLAQSQSWQPMHEVRYPSTLRQGVSQTGQYFILVKSDLLLGAQPYTLQVSSGTVFQACFDDLFDPQDDQVSNARPIGVTPALQFSESYQSNLCLGDQDFYCFVMSPADGLDVTVDTHPNCDRLQVDLAPSSQFTIEEERLEGYRLERIERAEGDRYQILLDQESNIFTQDEWCIRIKNEEDAMCESYQLNTVFTRRQLICSDLREPNNNIQQASVLDQEGPLADAQGDIPYDQALELNENMYLCASDLDVFQVQTQMGDVWRAWIIDDSGDPNDDESRGQVFGELKVRFIDDVGNQIGDSASLNDRELDMAAIQKATAISSFNGSLWIQVLGESQGEGPYRLYLQRSSNEGLCSQDVNEPISQDENNPLEGDRNLNPVSQLRTQGEQRLGINNGYLCDPGIGADEDWYRFEVLEDSTRICLSSQFRHVNGDINIELFEYEFPVQLDPNNQCSNHDVCRARQPESSCILGYCRVALERAQSLDDGELIHFSASEGDAGQYVARVYSPTQEENTYNLNVTMLPPSDLCQPDYHEGAEGNNRSQDATVLGSGKIQFCDTWLCESERQQGDWYEITVPAFAARSIHVNFETLQGRLTLGAEDVSSVGGQIVESPNNQSRNVHCINVATGNRAATIRFQVAGDLFYDSNQRIDYVLQVVPTNVDNGQQGACNSLNAGLFTNVAWPLIDLR